MPSKRSENTKRWRKRRKGYLPPAPKCACGATLKSVRTQDLGMCTRCYRRTSLYLEEKRKRRYYQR